jgi:hypothetical protein
MTCLTCRDKHVLSLCLYTASVCVCVCACRPVFAHRADMYLPMHTANPRIGISFLSVCHVMESIMNDSNRDQGTQQLGIACSLALQIASEGIHLTSFAFILTRRIRSSFGLGQRWCACARKNELAPEPPHLARACKQRTPNHGGLTHPVSTSTFGDRQKHDIGLLVSTTRGG